MGKIRKIKTTFLFAIIFIGSIFKLQAQNLVVADSLTKEIEKYDKQKKLLKDNSYSLKDTVKLNLLNRLWALYSRNNYKKALFYSNEMLILSEKINYKEGISKALVRLGISNDDLGNFRSAIDCYKKALTIQKEIDDLQGQTESYSNIGIVYSKQGNYVEALNNFVSALPISIKLKDNYGIGCCYMNMGIVFKQQSKYKDAIYNYMTALKYFTPINANDGVAACYTNVGDIYILENDIDNAIINFKKAIAIVDSTDEKFTISESYHSLGLAYLKKIDYDSALFYFQKAFAIRSELGEKYGIAGSLIKIGEIYSKKGNYSEAKKSISDGLKMAMSIGGLSNAREGYKMLSDIYFKEKNYKLAYENQVKFKEINDSIFNEEKEKKFTQLQLNYQFQREKDSIETEHLNELKLINSEINSKERIRNYVYSGLSIIVLLLVVTIIQRNKLAHVKRVQALEEERTRISRDLHDDLGSGLTGIIMMSEQINMTEIPKVQEEAINDIKKTSKLMVDQMSDIVWAMNSKNDSLENLISYIHVYAQDFLEKNNVQLVFNAPDDYDNIEMSGVVRRNVFLVLKETLNNTIKYSKATVVEVNLEVHKNNFKLIIADNGIGFDKEKTRRFGNGLINMKERMIAIKGTFNIESLAENGTKTTISLVS